MAEQDNPACTSHDLDAVRTALRVQLIGRGHRVASDTLGMGKDLYILDAKDMARALFEFKASADVAVSAFMYQGTWAEGMPPRFAVLPGSEANSPALDMLEQTRSIPLFFDVAGDAVVFRELDLLLRAHLDS